MFAAERTVFRISVLIGEKIIGERFQPDRLPQAWRQRTAGIALWTCLWCVNPNIKLATFTRIILMNKSFRIACSPGYLWDFRQNNGSCPIWGNVELIDVNHLQL